MTASKTLWRIVLGRMPTNCSRIVLRVAWRPAELDPELVRHAYPSGRPPLARTVERHACRADTVASSRPDCERSTAAKAELMAFWTLRAAAERAVGTAVTVCVTFSVTVM
jgi:hypothetical protein